MSVTGAGGAGVARSLLPGDSAPGLLIRSYCCVDILIAGSSICVKNNFECMEMLGTIPQQLRYVLVVLIPKATTGLRPIGIFCALYRLWAKCRTAMAQSCENLNPRPYFAARKGRAVTDPTWRHAVAVECGVGHGEETVSVWRDFAQFYERMEHYILQANAETFCFPLPVLRVAVPAYKCNVCWYFMSRQPPLDTPQGEW